MSSASAPDSSERLQALIADYALLRDDERQHTLALAALFTILVAVVFAEATQLLSHCTAGAASCTSVPGLVFAIAPAPAFAVLAFTVLIGTEATMRYAYMVALEREIDMCGLDLRLDELHRPPFSWQRARRPLVIFRAGPFRRFPFPYLFAVMVAPVVLIVVALTVYCLSQITPPPVALAVAFPYVLSGALIVYATGLGWRAALWESGPWEEGEPSWSPSDGATGRP
jgi:hypothetical protein